MSRPSQGTIHTGPLLIIESDLALARALSEALKPLGRPVLLARSGEDAESLLKQLVPAAVLVDFRLPSTDPLRLHRELGARRPHLRMLVLHPGALPARLFEEGELLPLGPDLGDLRARVAEALRVEPESVPSAPLQAPTAEAPPAPPEPRPEPPSVLRALEQGAQSASILAGLCRLSRSETRAKLRQLSETGLVERVGTTRWRLTAHGRAALRLR